MSVCVRKKETDIQAESVREREREKGRVTELDEKRERNR